MIRQDTKENIKNTFKESLLILIYEFLGSFMMATLFINYCKSRKGRGASSSIILFKPLTKLFYYYRSELTCERISINYEHRNTGLEGKCK